MAMTRDTGRRRRAAAVAALATATVLAWPATAYAADVTATPTEARQGEAVRMEFTVPQERPGVPTDQVEIRLPADAPIAEVYPMSTDGWAPRITTRTLDRPVPGIHSSALDTVTSSVTWVRMPGTGEGPARLTLSMGPLPQADRLSFEVLQTYADGLVVRWGGAGQRPAPTLALLPDDPNAPVGHAGHGGAPAAGGAPAPAAGGPAAEGNDDSLLAAGLLTGLGGGAVIGWLVSRRRGRAPAEPADPAT
ncbi:Uncharacterized protein YcnI [Micromonospora nigra]|uniref:Uncharacterized protein YcnI n=1 Tax=Micromonospora nigra TaxID=145857 RepID=A0A1C6SVK4_9ACTN|nr:DUF1775 domain-containing protein [Micromonospora nigra]SCL33399.1 Uncharacterized protein YcnI [Micromonospora nigra]